MTANRTKRSSSAYASLVRGLGSDVDFTKGSPMGSDLGPSALSGIALTPSGRPRVRLRVRILLATGTAGVMLGTAGVAASAARASSTADAEARVQVLAGITVSQLAESFSLAGAPDVITANLGALDLTVLTNNAAGYTVTVLATSEGGLQPNPALANSPGPIPWDRLEVREGGTGAFRPISEKESVTVGGSSTRSGDEPDGVDVIHDDFRLTVPVIDADRYSGVLTYTVTAL